nr:hypothetical protein [Chthoniobacterales bacterium]
LIREVFNRSAYGCRLYCCWCAQDLLANKFWEAMGFVPLAFRGGGGKKKRVHIYWQKKIDGPESLTPYWFPSKTDQGAMRADRIVLPIPPGLHWSDPMPVLVPDAPEAPQAPHETQRAIEKRDPQPQATAPATVKQAPVRQRAQFSPPSANPETVVTRVSLGKPRKAKQPKVNVDPQLINKARELRDRWLEKVNDLPMLAGGKYAVSRALPTSQAAQLQLPCGEQHDAAGTCLGRRERAA